MPLPPGGATVAPLTKPLLLLFNVQGIKVLICWNFVLAFVISYETNVVKPVVSGGQSYK